MKYFIAFFGLLFYVFIGIFAVIGQMVLAGIETQCKVINLWYETFLN